MSYLILSLAIAAIILFAAISLFKVDILLPKLVTLTMVFMVGTALFFGFESFKGWPTTETLYSGDVLGIVIQKPKSIFVWTFNGERKHYWYDIFGYEEENVPRNYVLPWSKELDKMFTEAKQKLYEGGRVHFQLKPKTTIKKKDGTYITADDIELDIKTPREVLKK